MQQPPDFLDFHSFFNLPLLCEALGVLGADYLRAAKPSA